MTAHESAVEFIERNPHILCREIPDGFGGSALLIYSRHQWKDLARIFNSSAKEHLDLFDSVLIFPNFSRIEGVPSAFHPGAVAGFGDRKKEAKDMDFAVPYNWLQTIIEVANNPDAADFVSGYGHRKRFHQAMLNVMKRMRDQTKTWERMELMLLGDAAANLAAPLGLQNSHNRDVPLIRTERMKLKQFPYLHAVGVQLPADLNWKTIDRPVALLTGLLDSGMEVAAAIAALQAHRVVFDTLNSYSVIAPNSAAYWLKFFRETQTAGVPCLGGQDFAMVTAGYIGHDGYAHLGRDASDEPVLLDYPEIGKNHDLLGGDAATLTQIDPLTE